MSLVDQEGRAQDEPRNGPGLIARSWLRAARARLTPETPRRVRFAALAALAGVTGLMGVREVLKPVPRPPVPAPEARSTQERGPAGPVQPEADLAPVLKFKPLSPTEAYLANAAVPDFPRRDPAAAPLVLRNAVGTVPVDAATCLAQAVYYEAGSESPDGQRAVAQVVLNRVRDPRYPGSVCGVVFQGAERSTGCQFSFTCDGSTRRAPDTAGWRRAQSVAQDALDGYVMAAVGRATHYHTVWVTPYWSPTLIKLGRIGAHIFYRWGDVAPAAAKVDGEASSPPADPAVPLDGADAVAAVDAPASPEAANAPAPPPAFIHGGAYSPPPRPTQVSLATSKVVPPSEDPGAAPASAGPPAGTSPAPAAAPPVATPVDPPYHVKSSHRSLDDPRFGSRANGP